MEKLIAAYQGVEGCHSSLVLRSYFKKAGLELQADGASTFRQVAMNVISGKADVGLLPVDNAIAGTIREGYDLLAQYDLVPISEIEWKMDHRLLAPAGAEPGQGNGHGIEKIREVLAHPLVLEECGRFLGTLIGARVVPVEDTGLAAREVASSKDPARAAIAPPEAAALYGLVELATNIADHPGNYTRFILFRAQTAREVARKLGRTQPSEQRKTSLLLSTAHEAGSLVKCLNILTASGINLSKLESRPKLGKAWEYLFYVDFEGDLSSPGVEEALSRLRSEAQYIQVIGSYDRHRASDEAHTLTAAVSAAPAEPIAHEGHTSGAPHGWSADLLPSSAKGWPKAARSAKPQGSRFKIGPVEVGGDGFVVIAGPCSVESREQVLKTAQAVRESGAVMLRGGVFKPRTNPYAFQGMGWEGLTLLSEAGRVTGMPIVSEVMSLEQVERMARECDMLQIGARNMQNFDLLRAVGKTDRTILLKRGMSASIDELLAAAEYVLAEGNPHVMLCERGIRTFETATRNTLDLSAVPVLRERTHLPIIVDPSHGVGVRRWIRPLCRAAKAVGAHGIIIEVHPNPDEATSDKEQALTFDDFRAIMGDLAEIPHGRP